MLYFLLHCLEGDLVAMQRRAGRTGTDDLLAVVALLLQGSPLHFSVYSPKGSSQATEK